MAIDWKKEIQRTNWYIALDLPFDPPETDIKVIQQQLESKKKFWNQRQTDASMGSLYAEYISKADQILEDLSSPEIRRQHYEQAQDKRFGALDKQLALLSANGKRAIDEKKLTNFANTKKIKELGFTADEIRKRAESKGYEIAEDSGPALSNEEAETCYDSEMKPSAEDKRAFKKFDGFNAHLTAVGCRDFYSFLKPGVDPASLTTKELYEEAELQRKSAAKGKQTKEKTSNRDAAADARKAFESEEARKSYDAYLAFRDKRAVIADIKDNIEGVSGGKCNRQESDEYINQLMAVIPDRMRATNFFIALCIKNNFEFDVSDDSVAENQNILVCRCRQVNDVSDGRKVCQSCGKELVITCPQCEKQSLNSVSFCSCGFDFNNILRAERCAGQAKEALDTYDLVGARKLIDEAKALFSTCPLIAPVEGSLQTLESRIGEKVKKIAYEADRNNCYLAQSLITDLKSSFPQYSNVPLESRISTAVAQAQAHLGKARQASSEDQALEFCKQAFEVCADIPGLREEVAKYTDLPVEALSVGNIVPTNLSASVVNGKVIVRFDLPNEGETGIIAAYRFDDYPQGVEDPQAIIREMAVKTYQRDQVFELETPQDQCYYIAVALKANVNDQDFSSTPVFCQLNRKDKVRLTYSFTKKKFGKGVKFEVEADKPIKELPEIHIAYMTGRPPVYLASSKLLQIIPAQTINGRFECKLDIPKSLPKNTFAKPFLATENSNYQLKVAVGSEQKIR